MSEANKFVVPVYLIDLINGKLDGEPILLEDIVLGLSFHKKMPILAVASCNDKGIMIWNVSDKKPRLIGHLAAPRMESGALAQASCVEFCPEPGNEHLLAGAFLTGQVARWEVNLRDLKLSKRADLATHNGGDTCVHWCRNGNLVSCGGDGVVRLHTTDGAPRVKEIHHSDPLLAVQSVSEREFLITHGIGGRKKFPHPQLLRFGPRGPEAPIDLIVPKGSKKFPGPSVTNEWFQTVAVSRSGVFAATSGNDNHEIIVWKLLPDQPPDACCRFGGEIEGPWAVGWAKDGTGFAFHTEPARRGEPSYMQAFDFRTFALNLDRPNPENYQNDQVGIQGIRAAKEEGWDTVTVTLGAEKSLEVRVPKGTRVMSAAISSQVPKRLALGTSAEIFVYDADNAQLLVQLTGHVLDVRCLSFSPKNSNLLLSAGADQRIYLWNLESRTEEFGGIGVVVRGVAQGWRIERILPDGAAAKDGQLQPGDILEQCDDINGRWVKLAGLPINKTGSPLRGPADTRVKLWCYQAGTGKRQMIALTRKMVAGEKPQIEPHMGLFFAGSEWVAWTSNGYYNSSASGDRLMGWQADRVLYELGTFLPAEAFRQSLHQPEVLKKLVTTRSVQDALKQVGPSIEVLQVGKIVPPRVSIISPAQGEQKNGLVTVKAKIEDVRDNKIQKVQLLVNHQVVVDARKNPPAPLAPSELVEESNGTMLAVWKDVPIQPGPQVLQAQVQTQNATELSGRIPIQWGKAARGDLHLIAFGTSTVPKGNFGWIPAPRGCEGIHELFSSQVGPGKLYARLLTHDCPLLDKQATRVNLLTVLRAVQQEAKPEDTVVVFLSAHAVAEAGRYFLIPYDADPANLGVTAIPMTDVKEYLASTKGTRLLLLDCCFAGSVNAIKIETEIKDSRNNSGLIIGCSCQGHQKAHDNCPTSPPRLSLFTYAVMQTLSGRSLEQKAGSVSLADIEYHVRKQVVRHSQEFNARQVPFFDYARDLDATDIVLAKYAR
ncbi:caspase family protein [Zavarzinella formosa]|uniref:caspase family protein n=1 Tax=Zavarzinella formosa TaxID=360055 RepID=UPI001EE65F8F|nr:caspase family protein [Zavarzinella formosa]